MDSNIDYSDKISNIGAGIQTYKALRDRHIDIQMENLSDITEGKLEETKLLEDSLKQNKSSCNGTVLTVLLLGAMFSSFISFTIIAPIFPTMAKSKGLGESQIGVVFCIVDVVGFIGAPIYGALINTLTVKRMCVAGTFLSGGSCLLFGMMYYVEGPAFFILCLLLRFIEGNGVKQLHVAATSLLMKKYPDSRSLIFSFIEAAFGLGCIAGPSIGSGLYNVGGYITPFLTNGGTLIIFSVVLLFYMPNTIEPDNEKNMFIPLLKIPGMLVLYAQACIGAMIVVYVDPVISEWLIKSFPDRFSVSNVGFVFTGWSVCYVISTLAAGKIADKGLVYISMVIGLIGVGLSFLMLAPSPLLNFLPSQGTPHFVLAISSMMLIFLFDGFILIPSYQALIHLALLNGLDDNMATHGMAASLQYSAIALGSAIGPSMSGLLTERYGFNWSSTAAGLTVLSMSSILTMFVILMKLSGKPLKPAAESKTS